jgi:trehalose-phosphatase
VAGYWRERVRAAQNIALFLDFDGTLSPIAPRPELAAIDPQAQIAVERLRDLAGVQIAIVSGRALGDVRARAGIDGIIYAGNHGLEIETDTLCFQEPRAESLRLEIRRLELRLEQVLSDVTGVEVEKKGLGVSVHYRQVHESLQAWVRAQVEEMVRRSPLFTLLHGKMVLDIRPAVDWNKGHAVRWLLDRSGLSNIFSIYVGDDITDEDGFAALRGDALTIRVGYDRHTLAQFWVPDVCSVRSFLVSLYELRSGGKRT